MKTLFLHDDRIGYPFAALQVNHSTFAGLSDRIAALCAEHYRRNVAGIDFRYFEHHSTLLVQFASGWNLFIDASLEADDDLELDVPDEPF